MSYTTVQNLKIKEERNNIELVLEDHDFDFHKTVNSFVNGTAKDFLDDWKLCSWKKKHEKSTTSTPKTPLKMDSSSTFIDLSTSSKDLTDDSNRLFEDKPSDAIVVDKLMKKRKSYEKDIKEYEMKIESRNDTNLRDYYIKSATQIREQIRILLEIYKQKMINQHSSAEIHQLSMNVHHLMHQHKC